LLSFLDKLEISYFRQYTKGVSLRNHVFVPPQKFKNPDTEEPSYRIQGGTQTLINRLVTEIGVENIVTSTKVKSIKVHNQLELTDTNGNQFVADKVVSYHLIY
jgi:monoamine oxidase